MLIWPIYFALNCERGLWITPKLKMMDYIIQTGKTSDASRKKCVC